MTATDGTAIRTRVSVRTLRRMLGLVLRALPWIWIIGLVLAALVLPHVLPHSPNAQSAEILYPPGDGHLFGTDDSGRDVLARVIAGAGTSFQVAGLAILIGLVGGGLLGMVAASTLGVVDGLIMRCMDVLLAFPAIVLALLMSLLLGDSILGVSLLIGVVMTPQIARVVRNRLVTELEQGYVVAERAAGASWARIQFVHVSRNVMAPIGAFCLLLFADAILFEAALSYVGVGIQPPTASWGNMILEGQRLILVNAWWVSIFPGIALFGTIAAVNIIGDRWLAEIDPLLREAKR